MLRAEEEARAGILEWRAPSIERNLRLSLSSPTSLPKISLDRSEEHTSELQSLMRISYAVFCLKKKNDHTKQPHTLITTNNTYTTTKPTYSYTNTQQPHTQRT